MTRDQPPLGAIQRCVHKCNAKIRHINYFAVTSTSIRTGQEAERIQTLRDPARAPECSISVLNHSSDLYLYV